MNRAAEGLATQRTVVGHAAQPGTDTRAANLTGAEPATSADSGLVARWDFDEGADDVAMDLTGHGNDGRLHGPQWVQRRPGCALAFDGVDDYVDCGQRARWT